MLTSEITQLEDQLSHETTFVNRQPLLKRLWKLRQEQLASRAAVVLSGIQVRNVATEVSSYAVAK